MPRIVPIQLLKCLKVLLDDNGGILSAGEVKRLASLMTKYSKKLVSKCIYVQILKCTKTELLGEFMGAGGWSLVYTWLNDAIRAMNWPLVQEILELLLLCPVDVHRLKINSAPKLVKGLCKDGGNEGVRILAKRLVEQWLKVVTENPEATLASSNMTPQIAPAKLPTPAVVASDAISSSMPQQQSSLVNSTTNEISSAATQKQKQEEQKVTAIQQTSKKIDKVHDFEEDGGEDEEEEEDNSRETTEHYDQDPLGGVDSVPTVTNYTLTPAQKKASESGLVYKFIIKDGQSILAKVPPKSSQSPALTGETKLNDEEEEPESSKNAEEDAEENEVAEDEGDNTVEADENSSSLDKIEKDDSNSSSEDKTKVDDGKKLEDKKSTEDKDKTDTQKEQKSSKDKERRSSNSSLDKDKDSKSSKSSSSSHRSSSSHKSSSSKSSSSSSKSKSSSSSSSSHRSSSDKHRSDKERSSSSKDKDKEKERSSSSSSKHRSSSSSKSSSSKDKYRDKDKEKYSSSKSKDKQDQSQADKEKSPQEKVALSPSASTLEKLSKLTKKTKEEANTGDSEGANKPTSITIPSKKASMSIEIRKDTEKSKTVKTYKSQFRSHGLTEEAPPPPSRKGLKKPSSSTPPGTVLPSSLPSSLKRTSPPPRDSPSEKKAKLDINNLTVANEKPGAIKLIPPKKIQTLVETNLFSDALSAATGPKKVTKRKRPNTPLVNGKEGPSSPTSPEAPKVMPLKFYQDTLDESKTEESKSDKENDESSASKANDEIMASIDDKDMDDDDDIPLKKVKEDIEQKVALEKKLDGSDKTIASIDVAKDDGENKNESSSSPSRQQQEEENDDVEIVIEKKPGPGCGPNGPPGVLMLHRRRGPKKKLTWRPQESLEQVRYFELDENERCNVTKTSFMDMKNLERFNERDAIVLARRGFNQEDNMEAQTNWKPLIEVDDVPPHPEGNQSKQRKIQAERELTTLRALYFTHALIPDSPAEAEFEPVFNHDVPLIPLDDLTGNPDAVNDFTSMPWPEPRGSPKQGDNSMSGTGGLGSPVDMFGSSSVPITNVSNNNKQGGGSPFNPFVSPFVGNQGPNGPNVAPMQSSPQNQWQGPPNGMVGPMGGPGPMGGNGPMMNNPFNSGHGSPVMDMGGPGPMGPGPMMNNGPQNFMNQFSNNFGGHPNNPFMGGPPTAFNNGPNNFGPLGPNGGMMNGIGPGGPGPMMGNNCPPQMMNGGGGGGHNNRNNMRGNNGGGNWRSGGSNFQDNNGGGNNWRPAGSGPNNRGGGGGGNGNNGVCKAFMRGHCRLGNSCKYIHPNKSKRI